MADKRTIYRDHKTGRFAKKSTWKRSVKRGSKRYTRERVALPKRLREPGEEPEEVEEEIEEAEAPQERELAFGYGSKRKGNNFEGTMFLGPDGSITKFLWNNRTYTNARDIALLEGVLKASDSDPREDAFVEDETESNE